MLDKAPIPYKSLATRIAAAMGLMQLGYVPPLAPTPLRPYMHGLSRQLFLNALRRATYLHALFPWVFLRPESLCFREQN